MNARNFMQTEQVRRYAGRFVAHRAWQQLLNIVFPEDRAYCALCFRPVSIEWSTEGVIVQGGGGFTGRAADIPSEISVRLCFSCLQDAALTRLSLRSRKLALHPSVPVVSAVEHDGFLRSAIRQWKYDGGTWWTSWFASLALSAAEATYTARFDVVVPVPTTRDRFLKRGYNHVKLLSDVVAHDLGIPTQNWLVRGISPHNENLTQSQTAKSAVDRRSGLEGQFRTVSESLPGQRVLLVDDVVTTGATLYACAAALQSAGVRDVSALTVAHVL